MFTFTSYSLRGHSCECHNKRGADAEASTPQCPSCSLQRCRHPLVTLDSVARHSSCSPRKLISELTLGGQLPITAAEVVNLVAVFGVTVHPVETHRIGIWIPIWLGGFAADEAVFVCRLGPQKRKDSQDCVQGASPSPTLDVGVMVLLTAVNTVRCHYAL